MVFAVSGTIEGLPELLKTMEGLKKNLQKKILRAGVNEGSKIILKAAKAKCKAKFIKKSLGRRVKVYRGKGTAVGIIGPRKGQKDDAGRDPSNIAHLEEFGRKSVEVKTKKVLSDGTTIYGTKVQADPGRPFLRPAFDEARGQVGSAMAAKMAEILEKEAAKSQPDSGPDDVTTGD